MLDPVVATAVNHAIRELDARVARERLTPGTYPVDAIVRLQGELVVAPDSSQLPPVPLREVLGLLVREDPTLLTRIRGAAELALLGEDVSVEVAKVALELNLAAAGAPRPIRKGRVTARLVVEAA